MVRQRFMRAHVMASYFSFSLFFVVFFINRELSIFALCLSTVLVAFSFTLIYWTGGEIFFNNDKEAKGYNLLYIWVVIGGVLGLAGADAFDTHSALVILLVWLLVSLIIIFLSYFILSKFWNGKDSWVSVSAASIFLGGGYALASLQLFF